MRHMKDCCLAAVLGITLLFAASNARAQDTAFSDAVAESLVSTVRKGLIGHNAEVMLSAFDGDRMAGYQNFADQVRAWFNQYESFRVYARVTETSVSNGRGIAMVEFQLEETPYDPAVPAIRKTAQLQLQFERGTKGWKVVDLRPRGFFS